MSKKRKKVFASFRKKSIIRDILLYTMIVGLLLFDTINICYIAMPVVKEETTEIIGKVSEIQENRPVQHSIVYLNFSVEQNDYVLCCYGKIKHNDELIELIEKEEKVTLLVKERNSLLANNSLEIFDVRTDTKVYYDIEDINIQRKNYIIGQLIFHFFITSFFTLLLVLNHLSDIKLIYKQTKKKSKRVKDNK